VRDSQRDGDGDRNREEIGGTTAPSIGPNTVIEKEPPEERLARKEQSETDALGLDKRRNVIGGRYSPSVGRQAAMYGIFLAVLAALAIGAILLVDKLDQPPDKVEAQAPWAQPGAPQHPPKPLQ
jgi:hypothetical protein